MNKNESLNCSKCSGCLESFSPTFNFNKIVSNKNKYKQAEFYKKSSNKNLENIPFNAKKRINQHLQLLTDKNGKISGYFD